MVFNTSMNRPDAALALAAMFVFDNKHDARMGAVCVTGAGLDTAIFCDMVGRLYVAGPPRNTNQALPVGLADVTPMPPDAPMIASAVNRRNDAGDDLYTHSIRKVTDTAQAQAVLRNGVIFNAETVVLLSAPATDLAISLDLAGAKSEYVKRVRGFVIVDSGTAVSDPAALRKVIAEWPTPIIYCGPDIGEALPFPGNALDRAFAWTPASPVADAYRAFKAMPYDAPSYDLAALHYAVHPDSGFFTLSEPGALTVSSSGAMKFTAGAGPVRRLVLDAAKRDAAIAALVTVLSTKPVAPPARGRGPGA